MPALHDLQRAFARGVLTADFTAIAPHVVGADRLGIYRNTVRVVLTQSLRLSFPAVDRLVGEAFFDHAADRFISRDPPRTACLGDYGEGFAAFLAAMPEAAGIAYLADVAAYEWALACAARADDTPAIAIDALASVPEALHGAIRLRACPGVAVLHPAAPVDRIVAAVLADDDAAMAAIDLADIPPGILIQRSPGGVTAERLDDEAARLLPRLLAGEPLGAVAEAGGPGFAALLARQFLAGRIAGFTFGART